MAAFGETIIYTPADQAFAAFECLARKEEPTVVDELEGNVVADRCLLRVSHAALVDGGLAEPTKQISRGQAGDTVARKNIKGETEAWIVVNATPDEELGEWVLELKKNIRVTPS
jgi:hypothetical protein